MAFSFCHTDRHLFEGVSICIWRRRWHPTPVLLPGKSHGRRAWWAAVHGVAKSWTQLSYFTLTFHFHALEKEMATHSSVLVWRIPGMEEPGWLPSTGSHRVGHDWRDLAAAFVLNTFLLPPVELTQNSVVMQKGQVRESLNFIYFPVVSYCQLSNWNVKKKIFPCHYIFSLATSMEQNWLILPIIPVPASWPP